MMKACQFAFVLAALSACSDAAKKDTRRGLYYAARKAGLRNLKHDKHHKSNKHHKAIQDKYAKEKDKLAYDDDFETRAGYLNNFVSNQELIFEHYPGYLDESIKPLPFQNCIPESYHANNQHDNDHHHEDNFLGQFDGIDDKDSKGVKGDKAKSKAKKSKKAAGAKEGKSKAKKAPGKKASKTVKSKGMGKGMGMDITTRALAQTKLRTATGRANAGKRREKPLRRGNMETRAGIQEFLKAGAEEETSGATKESVLAVTDATAMATVPLTVNDGTKHHPHKHTHKNLKGSLPLCPNATPKRRTFEPIPTVPPREPSAAPIPVAAAPTVVDGGNATTAPVAAGASSAPQAMPAEEVLVESRMTYDFFDEYLPMAVEPTMEQIDALLMRTSTWFETQLKTAYPNLESFEARYVDQLVMLGAEPPIQIDFDANARFTPGSTLPTSQQVFMAMEALNLQDYILNAVHGDATSPFEQVEKTAFHARTVGGR